MCLLTYLLLTLFDPRGGVLIPTDQRTAANKRGYDLGGVCPGGFGRTLPEIIGDSKKNLIEFCALVNLKPQ